eukprot:COSAG01_NODE_2884_length_6911_cov_55.460804_5_plen_85_part_01
MQRLAPVEVEVSGRRETQQHQQHQEEEEEEEEAEEEEEEEEEEVPVVGGVGVGISCGETQLLQLLHVARERAQQTSARLEEIQET